MTLLQLFARCLEVPYLQAEESANYYTERIGMAVGDKFKAELVIYPHQMPECKSYTLVLSDRK